MICSRYFTTLSVRLFLETPERKQDLFHFAHNFASTKMLDEKVKKNFCYFYMLPIIFFVCNILIEGMDICIIFKFILVLILAFCVTININSSRDVLLFITFYSFDWFCEILWLSLNFFQNVNRKCNVSEIFCSFCSFVQ